VALKPDGQVWAWGWNYYGQTNTPASLSAVTAIAAGGYHSLALKADGTVVAWGRDDYHQATVPASLNQVVAIAAGQNHSVAVRADGSVAVWGQLAQGDVPADATAILTSAGGASAALALKLIAPQLSVPVMTPGGCKLQLFGASTSHFIVQTSTNLVAWQDWTNLVTTNLCTDVILPWSLAEPGRFFRARTQ
jgi:hypothetical protein